MARCKLRQPGSSANATKISRSVGNCKGPVSVVWSGGWAKMTLILIWFALSVVLGACVCRVLTLSGPGNPEKLSILDTQESFSDGHCKPTFLVASHEDREGLLLEVVSQQ